MNLEDNWILCVKEFPKENQEVLLTFRNEVGYHVGEATYKRGSYFYIAETDNGYYEEQYGIPVAWMRKPEPYVL